MIRNMYVDVQGIVYAFGDKLTSRGLVFSAHDQARSRSKLQSVGKLTFIGTIDDDTGRSKEIDEDWRRSDM